MRAIAMIALTLIAVVASVLAAPRPAAGGYGLTTLATFNNANGSNAGGTLIRDAQGNLFGTTVSGGAFNQGTVFELVAGSSSVTTVASFNGANGNAPSGGVVQDAQGNLFGTTQRGGAFDQGTVYEIAAGSSSVTTLVTFNGANGGVPLGHLLIDPQGNLLGTTSSGNGFPGTVFQIAAGSSTLTTLATFNGANGSSPYAGLVRDSRGNLFGTTTGGINGPGTVFEIASGSSTITTLASFNGANGSRPLSGTLAIDARGNLFGTTEQGGAFGRGTVFELAAGSSTITTLATFNVANGSSPFAELIFDAQGNLFGTTGQGGANGRGTVFELSTVPEPASLVMLGLGLMGSAALVRRARTRRDGNHNG